MAAQGKVVPCENSHTAAIEKAHSGGARLAIAFGRSASPAFPVVRRRLDDLAGLGALKIEAEQAGREVWFELHVEKGLVEHYRRIANLLQLVRRWKSLEVTADGEVLDPFTIDSLMNRLGEIRQCWQRRKQGGAAACRKEGGLGCRMVNLAPSERFLTGACTTLPPWHAVGRFENGALVIDKDGLRQQLGRRANRLLRECPLFDCGAVDAAIDALPENLAPDGVNYRAVCRRSDGLVVWVWPAHLPLPPGLTMRSDGRTEGDVETTGSVAATASRVLPPTTYAHVCGQDAAVEAVRDLIELPLRHAELFASIGAAALPSGVILAGPPGTGKTLLARAVAGSCGCHLEIVSGPELLNPYVGATEKAIREVFQRAQNHAPAIILFDELDSIAPTRATADAQHQRSVTAQLLTLLDGLEARKQVFALATTNRPEHIDSALRRPGRFDRVVWMGPPKHQGRTAILRYYMKPLRLAPEINREALIQHLAENTRGASGAELQHLCQTAARICVKDIASQKPAPASSAITQAHFLQALEEFTQLRKRR
ncbi:MAG: ATP-binding protein [Candidatus Sumerlaeia bacterium]